MMDEPVFRPGTEGDIPELASRIKEVSPEVVDTLLKGLLPGISAEHILTMALRDKSTHYSYRNCVIAEMDGIIAGLLFGYPAEEHTIPPLMERMVPSSRLEPLRELLTMSVPGSLYINTLWVNQEIRGMGMADALMDYARFWAESLGKKSLSLFCWRDNERARAFYLKQGFIPVRKIAAKPPITKFHESGDLFELKLESSS